MFDENINEINANIPLVNDVQNVPLAILIKNIHSLKISFSSFELIKDAD